MKSTIASVVNYRNTLRDERPSVEDIFSTDYGKMLGSQIDEILDFTKRGQVLLLLLPLTKILERVQGFIADGTYRQALTSMLPPKDIKKIEAFEVLMEDVDTSDHKETVEDLIDEEDKLWYFSLITFTVYAYVDVYSKTLIKTISKNQSLTLKLGGHLRTEALEHQDDEERKYVTEVRDMDQYGIARRLHTIETGLFVDEILSTLMDSEMLQIFRSSFSRIMKIRHKIAHRKPKLQEDEYSYEMFESELGEIEPDLDFTFAEISESFGFLKPIFGSIEGLALETAERIQRTMTIVAMAVLYPALLDAVVYELLRI